MSTAGEEASKNVKVAFGLVVGAGLATGLGASVVFIPSLVKLASRRVLASALGFSAGVMVYVSFVEIFFKSIGSFSDQGFDDTRSYIYATLCFFGGVVIMILIDFLLHCFTKGHGHSHDLPPGLGDDENEVDKKSNEEELVELAKKTEDIEADRAPSGNHDVAYAPHCVGCSENPKDELAEWQRMAREEEERIHRLNDQDGSQTSETGSSSRPKSSMGHVPADTLGKLDEENVVVVNSPSPVDNTDSSKLEQKDAVSDIDDDEDDPGEESEEKQKLIRMGMNTALAIGIHNFPEGLATFVAALGDPSVGAVLAIAIGIHNIPEGLCVAMPIYYATGSRWKAFGWALLSGLSEPLAALLGWLVLANVFADVVYASLFGIVAGMMIIISVKELLPTAHRYDDHDSVVTYSFIVGMMVMALSLVAFML